MNRRQFLQSVGCAAVGTIACGPIGGQAAPASAKPNIVLILADDLGTGDVGCYGSDHFKTPNIDKLAASGLRFTRGYTAPLCGPSRALILTGRYAFRTGATNQDATGKMKPEVETMMPKILKQAGYVTASVGKWGQLPLGPADFGFDEHLEFKGSGVYWNTQKKGKTYGVNGEVRELRDHEYLPDVMHTFLVDFITRHKSQPFFCYYPMSHVHVEILPTPDSAPDNNDLYDDNIRYMDKLVGRLIADLERLKLRENTLILFVGDNGTGGGYAERATIGGRRLSGQKGMMQEGGSLVPWIASWPGHTPVGATTADLVDSTDFVPTFAEIAGAPLPKDRPIDGQSFAAQLRGQKGKRRDWVFLQLGRSWYVRDAGWKLDQAGQLFDMSGAPFVETPVAADSNDARAMAARRKLQAALNQLNPAGGIVDEGDGSGRHANRVENRKKNGRPELVEE